VGIEKCFEIHNHPAPRDGAKRWKDVGNILIGFVKLIDR
jgi:hypothetical protein